MLTENTDGDTVEIFVVVIVARTEAGPLLLAPQKRFRIIARAATENTFGLFGRSG